MQRAAACFNSSPSIAESDPAKATWLLMKSARPALEPDGEYSIVAPSQAVWYALIHSVIAFFWALEPEALMVPVAQSAPPI